MNRRWTALAIGVGFLQVSLMGCGPSGTSPAQQFIQDQSGITTPHGQIDPGSVRDTEGVIEYKSTDEKWRRVSWKRLPDGKLVYGTPEEATPPASEQDVVTRPMATKEQ